MHCHHVKPVKIGGKDNYENLIFITLEVHRLIHAIKHETIVKYINKQNYSEKEIAEINKLREIAELPPIQIYFLTNPWNVHKYNILSIV